MLTGSCECNSQEHEYAALMVAGAPYPDKMERSESLSLLILSIRGKHG
jgi:hypothetical protein